MKTAFSPIEIWNTDENMRPFLKRIQAIKEEWDKLSIPTFKCNIEKPDIKGNLKSEIKQYPFYHQKLMYMLESLNWDYIHAIESFNENWKSFLCGKNLDITVTIL